jgi:acyl-CoA thioester hydrolase
MLSGYRFVHTIDVRFRDLDAIGHVNNAVYLTYLEAARIAYWLHVTRRTGVLALDIILARVEIDYRSPAAFGETLDVGVRVALLKRSSFVVELLLVERGSGRLVAESRNVLVYYDYAAGRSIPIPAGIRAQILAQDPEARQEG